MATDFHTPDDAMMDRLAASRRYWESQGRDGAPLVLPGAELQRLDLREQVLASAQLQGADLRGALLDSSILVRADLDGARLAGASLFAADASKASFISAHLAGIHAARSSWRRAVLVDADLTSAVLDDADLRGAELLRARLNETSLLRARLQGAVLLGSSLRDAEVTGAELEGSAVDEASLRFTRGTPASLPAFPLRRTPRRRGDDERRFEMEVRDRLRGDGLEVMAGFDAGPDLVVRVPSGLFAAIEVSTSANRERLFRLAERCDLIVVPDVLDVRAAMNNTPVARLSDASYAISRLRPDDVQPHGAVAMILRQEGRLRPYALMAERAREDPSFLSRLSVFLDSREDFLLGTRDRSIANLAPAHLDGAAAARGARWAETHLSDLRELAAEATRLRRGEVARVDDATAVAARAWELENELAAAVRRRD